MANITSTTCEEAESYYLMEYVLAFTTYKVVTPVYFLIGLFSRGLCLGAFYRHYKKDKAYAYHIMISISDVLEVMAITQCMITINNLAGFRLPGVSWFQGSYPLMWYSAHLASPFDQASLTVSLLISTCMTADRIFALTKPFLYKTVNHKRHQVIAAVCCFSIGLLTSISDMFRYTVIRKGDLYEIGVDKGYTGTRMALALATARNVVRIMANILLIVFSFGILIAYHWRVRKVGIGESSQGNSRAERRKREERKLILLTLCQSSFTTILMVLWNTYFTLVYIHPNFTLCHGKVMNAINDLVMQVGKTLQFFALCAISREFRRNILHCLKRK